jgi:hypothetical protein
MKEKELIIETLMTALSKAKSLESDIDCALGVYDHELSESISLALALIKSES